MGQGFFITATGTDLGKTYISALICKELKNKGFKTGYYKAAISGAEDLYNSDASYVALRAGLDLHNDVKVSYLFKEPLSRILLPAMSRSQLIGKLSSVIIIIYC